MAFSIFNWKQKENSMYTNTMETAKRSCLASFHPGKLIQLQFLFHQVVELILRVIAMELIKHTFGLW